VTPVPGEHGALGGAVFRTSADRSQVAERFRTIALWPGTFVVVLATDDGTPSAPVVAGTGGSRALTPEEFVALLPVLGWAPMTPLFVDTDREVTRDLLVWARAVAGLLRQPVHVPVVSGARNWGSAHVEGNHTVRTSWMWDFDLFVSDDTVPFVKAARTKVDNGSMWLLAPPEPAGGRVAADWVPRGFVRYEPPSWVRDEESRTEEESSAEEESSTDEEEESSAHSRSSQVQDQDRRRSSSAAGTPGEVTDETIREALAGLPDETERTAARRPPQPPSSFVPRPPPPPRPWAGPIGHEEIVAMARQVAEARKVNEPALPNLVRDAPDGVAALRLWPERFGLEMEFVEGNIPAILRSMWKAGLTRSQTEIGRYHTSLNAGYSEVTYTWTLEMDDTADGELVSPILRNTPSTRERALPDALGSITGNGGKPLSVHIHVSVPKQHVDVRFHAALLLLARAYQPELYRLATNPRVGKHRGYKYCAPLSKDGLPFLDGHRRALNFEHIHDEDAHVEFRVFDGGNEAELQIRIEIVLGLVAAARRLAADQNWQSPPYKEVGAYSELVQEVLHRDPAGPEAITVYEAGTPEETAGVRKLLETIFPDQWRRDLALALWVTTPWPGSYEEIEQSAPEESGPEEFNASEYEVFEDSDPDDSDPGPGPGPGPRPGRDGSDQSVTGSSEDEGDSDELDSAQDGDSD
jgi:hypothetical protein